MGWLREPKEGLLPDIIGYPIIHARGLNASPECGKPPVLTLGKINVTKQRAFANQGWKP